MTTNPFAKLTAGDFLSAIERLLPPGPAMEVWPGSVKERFWTAVANFFAKIHADIILLVDTELDPTKTINLLPRWEGCFGLPYSCLSGVDETDTFRHLLLLYQIVDPGGLNPSRYVEIATLIGYPGCSVVEPRPFTCDSGCEDTVYPDFWRFVWFFVVPQGVKITTLTCIGECNKPLRDWGIAALQCVISKRNRASRTVLFQYYFGVLNIATLTCIGKCNAALRTWETE